jgi:hypothetical protein
MAANGLTIKVETRIKWWLVPYLRSLNFFCETFDCEPDQERLRKIIALGVSTRIIG